LPFYKAIHNAMLSSIVDCEAPFLLSKMRSISPPVEGWQNADNVGILTGWFSEWESKANPKSRLLGKG
jgi:hypothetical protein